MLECGKKLRAYVCKPCLRQYNSMPLLSSLQAVSFRCAEQYIHCTMYTIQLRHRCGTASAQDTDDNPAVAEMRHGWRTQCSPSCSFHFLHPICFGFSAMLRPDTYLQIKFGFASTYVYQHIYRMRTATRWHRHVTPRTHATHAE